MRRPLRHLRRVSTVLRLHFDWLFGVDVGDVDSAVRLGKILACDEIWETARDSRRGSPMPGQFWLPENLVVAQGPTQPQPKGLLRYFT